MKKSMKKIIVLALSGLLVFMVSLVCGKPAGAADSGGKISVVTTIFPPYDFARQVVGDKADITMLLRPSSESHSFEPTPQDIIKIQNCDVFIYGGGESDEWVKGVLEAIGAPKMKIVTLMDCVEVVEEEIVEGMQEEEEEEGGEHEAEYDEHVWTSPRNAKLIVQKISDTFCEVDAANADVYKSNAAACLEKLDKLDAAFKDAAAGAVRKTLVFGDRFPFRYFADAYGLSYFAAFPGCSTETEASAATVAFLINKVRDEKIPVVFHIELSNENIADTICEATGAKKLLFHACHNISRDDFQRGATYLELMTANVEALKQALN
ncbi:MAG: metal ABC transporter substrate-binding protein [Synergistaceae bacterium]|jgi:zinc transport system substrate-binding protein|nr:metal ABC transporter substrate-binding protein [Synergistaceae bacterium]